MVQQSLERRTLVKNGCFEEIFADTARILEKWRSERANKVTPPWVHKALTELACACPDTKFSSSADKLGLNPTRLKKLRVLRRSRYLQL
jgi:hypothetical protein